MKRDMDLCRKILFAIEEQYENTSIVDLEIPGYTMNQVAYHCKILKDGGLVSQYSAQYDGDGLYFFQVGNLTWEGHDFLDRIREDTVWNKIKNVVTEKGLPMILDVVKQVSTTVIAAMTEGAIKAYLKP